MAGQRVVEPELVAPPELDVAPPELDVAPPELEEFGEAFGDVDLAPVESVVVPLGAVLLERDPADELALAPERSAEAAELFCEAFGWPLAPVVLHSGRSGS